MTLASLNHAQKDMSGRALWPEIRAEETCAESHLVNSFSSAKFFAFKPPRLEQSKARWLGAIKVMPDYFDVGQPRSRCPAPQTHWYRKSVTAHPTPSCPSEPARIRPCPESNQQSALAPRNIPRLSETLVEAPTLPALLVAPRFRLPPKLR